MRKYVVWLGGILVSLLVLLALFPPIVRADQLPDRPLDTTVVDQQGYLSADTIASIDQKNQEWERTGQKLQVGVYVTDHLNDDLESFSNELFRHWQVGFSGTDNGILLVIAIDDRQFRIETSDNAATVIMDIEAKDILDSSREFFRQEDYDAGVTYIVNSIGDRFYGTDLGAQQLASLENQETYSDDDVGSFFILIIVLVIIFIIIDKSSRGGRGGGPGSLLWMWVDDYHYHHHHHSDHSSSSFGGGGGWSGGGGGGGGASSGW